MRCSLGNNGDWRISREREISRSTPKWPMAAAPGDGARRVRLRAARADPARARSAYQTTRYNRRTAVSSAVQADSARSATAPAWHHPGILPRPVRTPGAETTRWPSGHQFRSRPPGEQGNQPPRHASRRRRLRAGEAGQRAHPERTTTVHTRQAHAGQLPTSYRSPGPPPMRADIRVTPSSRNRPDAYRDDWWYVQKTALTPSLLPSYGGGGGGSRKSFRQGRDQI